MKTDREVMQQALDVLEDVKSYTRHPDYDWYLGTIKDVDLCLEALRDRLVNPESTFQGEQA